MTARCVLHMRALKTFLTFAVSGWTHRSNAWFVAPRDSSYRTTSMHKGIDTYIPPNGTLTNRKKNAVPAAFSFSYVSLARKSSLESFTTLREMYTATCCNRRSRSCRVYRYKKFPIEKKNKSKINNTAGSLRMTSSAGIGSKIRTGAKLAAVLWCCSAAIGNRQNVAVLIVSSAIGITKISKAIKRRRKRKISVIRCKSINQVANIDQTKSSEQNTTTNIWDDEQRIQKALTKSKRSNDWVDQSMMHFEQSMKIITHEKEQERLKLEERKREQAKQWVQRTMQRQDLEIEHARKVRRDEKLAEQWVQNAFRDSK